MTKEEILSILDPKSFIGRAPEQVDEFLSEYINPIIEENKELLGLSSQLNV